MIVQGQTTIFKYNLLCGLESFAVGTPYTYKIALYDALANLDNSTTAYSAVNEITGSGYTAGGQILTPVAPNSDNSAYTAWVSFANAFEGKAPLSFNTIQRLNGLSSSLRQFFF